MNLVLTKRVVKVQCVAVLWALKARGVPWLKGYTFCMLCPSDVRPVEPSLEKQCSLLAVVPRVMSVPSSRLHPMSVTNLALQVVLLVDWEQCKAGLHTFPKHSLHHSCSLKQSSVTYRDTIFSRVMCHCLRIRVFNDPSDHLWQGCDWEAGWFEEQNPLF